MFDLRVLSSFSRELCLYSNEAKRLGILSHIFCSRTEHERGELLVLTVWEGLIFLATALLQLTECLKGIIKKTLGGKIVEYIVT